MAVSKVMALWEAANADSEAGVGVVVIMESSSEKSLQSWKDIC